MLGGPSSTSRALGTSRKRTDASAAGRRGGGERTSSSTAHQPDVRSPTSTRCRYPSTLQTSWLLTRLVVSRECSDRIGEPDILLDVSGVPDSGAIDLVEGLLSLGLSQLEPRSLGSHPVHLPQRLGGKSTDDRERKRAEKGSQHATVALRNTVGRVILDGTAETLLLTTSMGMSVDVISTYSYSRFARVPAADPIDAGGQALIGSVCGSNRKWMAAGKY
jgi:hypothetical protein